MLFFLSSALLLEARHTKKISKKAREARVVPRSDADWRTVIGSHTLTVVAPDSIFVCKKFNPPLAPHSRHGDKTLGVRLGQFQELEWIKCTSIAACGTCDIFGGGRSKSAMNHASLVFCIK